MFGQGFNKKFGGGGNKGGSNFGGGDSYEKKPPFGGDAPEGDAPDFEKKKIPGSGRPEDEGEGEDAPEKKPESDKEEGNEEETIEQVLELFDQITPLIEKLRNRK